MSDQTTTTKKARVSHMYHWNPTNTDYTNIPSLLNFLIEKKVLEVRERKFVCKYCGKQVANETLLSVHYFSQHKDKISLK